MLVGEQDEATPVPMSIELEALLPDAQLRILPNCAHVPQLQKPELFLEAISEFLTSPRVPVEIVDALKARPRDSR